MSIRLLLFATSFCRRLRTERRSIRCQFVSDWPLLFYFENFSRRRDFSVEKFRQTREVNRYELLQLSFVPFLDFGHYRKACPSLRPEKQSCSQQLT